MLFNTKKEATMWARQRKSGFMDLKRETNDKKRISMLNESIREVKIKPIKFSDGKQMYKVLSR